MDFKKFVQKGILLTTLIGCTFFPNLKKDYTLENLTNTTLSNGYEKPGGLSTSLTQSKQIAKQYGTDNIIFLERPTYQTFEDENGVSYHSFVKAPAIHRINETSPIYEFPQSNIDDFIQVANSGELTSQKPRGLILESIILGDNSILVSSSSSKKIFKIYEDDGIFKQETYKEDDELAFTSGMILGTDGKVYLAQIPLYKKDSSNPDGFSISRPKRIISLDSLKNIKIETNIPDIFSLNYSWDIPSNNSKYSGDKYNVGEQIKIIENSPAGKVLNGIDFYVSDLMERKIYQLSKNGEGYNVSVFRSNLNSIPTSMFVDEIGNLFITSAPIFKKSMSSSGDSTINELIDYPKVIKITGGEEIIYTLPLNFDFSEEPILEQEISGTNKLFSGTYSMSSLLSEDESSWDLYILDSYDGTLGLLSAIKSPP